MLYYQTVNKETLELLKSLLLFPSTTDFYLVGGTALSLQSGHRISIDLDFFTNEEFDSQKLLEKLKENFSVTPVGISRNSLTAEIENIKVDFIRHDYPLVKPIQFIENIRMVSKEDIAAMKLNSITIRGSKKDFYDLFELLNFFSLADVFDFFSVKYDDSLKFMVLKSLLYFDDADSEPSPVLIKNNSWDDVKNKIRAEVKKYSAF